MKLKGITRRHALLVNNVIRLRDLVVFNLFSLSILCNSVLLLRNFLIKCMSVF